MRIAFYSDNFYPELSGIVDSILLTGRTLEARGHAVFYAGPRYPERAYAAAKCKSAEEASCVPGTVARLPSLPLPFSPTGQSRLALPVGRTFKALRAFKPDILHTHSPYGAGFEALRAAKKLGVPLVGTNHTIIEEYYPLAPNLMRRFEAWYYNHCSFVSAPHQALIERMREKGFRREGGAVPNPVNGSFFCPPSERTNEKPVILYAGRLSGEKRVDVLMRAVALLVPRHPELSFVIAGDGAARSALEALARKLGIEKRVRFAGFLSHEKLALEFCNADIFSIMSTSDSQSLTLMQAYATGLPAVGARSNGLIDYIPPPCGFLVEPGDYRACAAALEKLIADKALREQMGKAATDFVARFAPEKVAALWENLYAQAARAR